MSIDPADPVALAQALIRCPSVTPADGGAQALLAVALEGLGFAVHRLRFGAIDNLYARIGGAGPHLCFAGHTDVVPPGEAAWRDDPFGGTIRDGVLYGRGATDMKGGVAAFVAACARVLTAGPPHGAISLLITGDEEGEAVDGTARVLDWMRARGEAPDFCLVGEPTNPGALGEMVKIGRRGSLNATLTVRGVQGHSAYPRRADNPVHRLVAVLAELTTASLDAGTERFEPSNLQVTSVDVGNAATNVIPAAATARINIRFNDRHDGARLTAWLHDVIAAHAPDYTLDVRVSGEAFVTAPGAAVTGLIAAIGAETGRTPALDTGGGTSDARFIAALCPVAEFGLVGASMHKADEQVPLADLETLTRIYVRFIGFSWDNKRDGPLPPPRTLLGGVVRLALFNSRGLSVIGATRDAFLGSLSPLIAIVLVTSALEGATFGWRVGLTNLLQALCFQLAQPVFSHLIARLWRREDRWLRYATAQNWCQLAIPVLGMAFVLVGLSFGAAIAPLTLIVALLGLTIAYWLALSWFLAWRALDLSPGRAMLFVLLLLGALTLLLAVPIAMMTKAAPAVPHLNT